MLRFEDSLNNLERRIEHLAHMALHDPVLENRMGHRFALRTQRKRYVLYLKNDRCCFCEKRMYADTEFGNPPRNRIATLEHIVPKSMGGPDSITNLTLSCWTCNNIRGIRDFDEFKEWTKDPQFLIEIALEKHMKPINAPKPKKQKNKFKLIGWALHEHYQHTELVAA